MERNRFLKKDSLAGKVIAFILVIIMVGIAILSGLQATYMLSRNIYVEDIHKDFKTKVANRYAYSVLDNVMWSDHPEYEIDDSMVLGAKIVYGPELDKKKSNLFWSYGDLKKYKEPIEEYTVDHIYSDVDESNDEIVRYYDVVLYLSKDLKPGSDFYAYDKLADWLIMNQNSIYIIGIVSIIIGALALIYLLSAVGHKKETLEIKGSFITKIPLDLYTILTAIIGAITIACGILLQSVNKRSLSVMSISIIVCVYLVCAFISLLWLSDVTVRIKIGKWWKNSIIYKMLRFVGKGVVFLIGKLPLVWKTLVIFGVVSVLELFGIFIFSWNVSGAFIGAWFIEKVVLFALVMISALFMKKLQIAGEKISGGDLEYQVDTSHMFMDFKKHGENLNQIGQGLNSAVDEKLKSERMKTELITNVSHDIKTPLTSIINYSDLIDKELINLDECEENKDNTNVEKIKEYSEVLNRHSIRLKRLIEDLIEASKASTGNIDVNLEPTEVGVMLAQTAGEYEDKLSSSDLTLVVNKPEEPVYIMADGRRLWRVMDNILNNVCKYAMPSTRVYLNLEKDEKENMAIITLKNISKEQLDMSPAELLERFVQGDKARKTEGNGLGLSIANSLTELQSGKLKLDIDGDLFKVILRFPYVG